MKKRILTILFMLSGTAYAQNEAVTDSTLGQMNKDQLTRLYIAQVNQIIDKIPYSVWGLIPQDKPLEVPKTKYIQRKTDVIEKQAFVYAEKNTEMMYEVVYYADKQDLVKAILYLQKVNSEILNVR